MPSEDVIFSWRMMPKKPREGTAAQFDFDF
jgi:hypothetical protein